jgi:hypothetical protein
VITFGAYLESEIWPDNVVLSLVVLSLVHRETVQTEGLFLDDNVKRRGRRAKS